MTNELQGLLERIQKEGVEKADAEAAGIVRGANERADAILRAAEAKAAEVLDKARKDSDAFMVRSTQTVEQAARDVILSVGQSVGKIFHALVEKDVEQSQKSESFDALLVRICEAYISRGLAEGHLELMVSPADRDRILAVFHQRFKQAVDKSIIVRSDNEIISGFKVSFSGKSVYHDFTREAIADAISQMLRPQIAEIVRRAAGK